MSLLRGKQRVIFFHLGQELAAVAAGFQMLLQTALFDFTVGSVQMPAEQWEYLTAFHIRDLLSICLTPEVPICSQFVKVFFLNYPEHVQDGT